MTSRDCPNCRRKQDLIDRLVERVATLERRVAAWQRVARWIHAARGGED